MSFQIEKAHWALCRINLKRKIFKKKKKTELREIAVKFQNTGNKEKIITASTEKR